MPFRLLPAYLPAAAVLLCGFAAGCATQGPKPTQEMTRAQALIEQANRSDAQRYAAADLQRAHDELNNADKANGNGKYDEARRYAEAAAVDADVATARAASANAQHAAKEVEQSNETLRQEAERYAGANSPTPDTRNPDPGPQTRSPN